VGQKVTPKSSWPKLCQVLTDFHILSETRRIFCDTTAGKREKSEVLVFLYLSMPGSVEQERKVPACGDDQWETDVRPSAANQTTATQLIHIHEMVVRLAALQSSVNKDAMTKPIGWAVLDFRFLLKMQQSVKVIRHEAASPTAADASEVFLKIYLISSQLHKIHNTKDPLWQFF